MEEERAIKRQRTMEEWRAIKQQRMNGVRHLLTRAITRARISGWGLPTCLLEQGEPVDSVDTGGLLDGSTPLTAALTVCYDNSGVTFIQRLLESKADPNKAGDVLYSELPVPPLVAAVRCGRTCRAIVVWQLLSAGADLGSTYCEYDMLSSMLRYRQCFRTDSDLQEVSHLLIDRGLDVDLKALEKELASEPHVLSNITNKAILSRENKARALRTMLAKAYNSDQLARDISMCIIEYL